MRPKTFSYTPAAADTDGYANDVTATSGQPFTLAATTAGDSLAHLVIITPSGSVTGSYVISGTDADGVAQSETLATNTTNAVTSVKYYATVTQVLAPSGLGEETVDIGWTGVSVSKTIPLDWPQKPFSVSLFVDISGTINYSVQQTYSNPLEPGAQPSTFTWMPHAVIASKTADTEGTYTSAVMATRVLVNSVSANATLAFTVIQSDKQ